MLPKALQSKEKFYEQSFVKSFGWYDDNDDVFIAMEYLPYGDLHKYLGSPLPESEGQHIVSQLLEGLHFMHDHDFAHRDLKPNNILVVREGPDWWVKIADFGISKRATEGLTALRTITGTPAFTAPEVFPFFRTADASNNSYTNAVDVWSLGVIAFLIPHQRDFIQRPEPLRPALETQKYYLPEVEQENYSPREVTILKPRRNSLDYSDFKPSASWSTQDQISVHESYTAIAVTAERAILAPNEGRVLRSQPVTPKYWNLQRELIGHSGMVHDVAFSLDGKQIASAGDNTVRLWDSATGAAGYTLNGYRSRIKAVVFSPDGKQIASAGDDTVRLWDSATGAASYTLKGYGGRVHTVAFSPDGKQIASGSFDQTVRLWDSATGAAGSTILHYGWVMAVAFSPDGKQIASGSNDGRVKLWELSDRDDELHKEQDTD
ncbi:MAG: hypothetical protein LQ342_006824 [Letrouitia transgressa]|nr:MAG: hypothetical protein LQ342_006824 [Letrouitia transgressa]